MAKVKYYAKENSTIGTHSFYAVPIPNGTWNYKPTALVDLLWNMHCNPQLIRE